MDLLPRRDAGRRECSATARPTRIAPRDGSRIPRGRRRAGRALVMLVALGALLLAASYPPFHLPFLSFVAIAPAVVLLRRLELRQDTRGALRWGFWYGFVTQGAVLYWLVVALWHCPLFSALGFRAAIRLFGRWHGVLFLL